jgi:cell division protein FtsB
MDNSSDKNPPVDHENLHVRMAAHEKAIAELDSERAQLCKKLETLRNERQLLEAVARKVASTRRASGSAQQT